MILFGFFPMRRRFGALFGGSIGLRFQPSERLQARKFGFGPIFMEQNWNEGLPDAICGKPRDERVAAPASV